MSHAATGKSPIATPGPVTVSRGIPSPDPVNIASSGRLVFNNSDSTPYLIQLWTHANDKHATVCIYLPANGSVTLQGDPDNPNSSCPYNLLTTTGRGVNPTAEGGHSIIIGSGPEPHKGA